MSFYHFLYRKLLPYSLWYLTAYMKCLKINNFNSSQIIVSIYKYLISHKFVLQNKNIYNSFYSLKFFLSYKIKFLKIEPVRRLTLVVI